VKNVMDVVGEGTKFVEGLVAKRHQLSPDSANKASLLSIALAKHCD